MNGGFPAALVVGGVMLFFGLLRAGANRPAKVDPATGEVILQCGPILVWVMGVLAVCGPIAMAIMSFIFPFKNEAEKLVPVAIGAFFLVLGGLVSMWALRRRTRVGDRGLASEYMIGRPQFLAWGHIERIVLSNDQELWLYSADGQKALLHAWFTGVKDALPIVRSHLPDSVADQYKSVIDRFCQLPGMTAA
jgi:hypothetical protein